MRYSFELFYSLSLFLIVSLLVTFSERGFLDLTDLHQRMENTRSQISILENKNKQLRRQVDLLQEEEASVLEAQYRERYNWVREDEIIYLEP